MLNEEESKQLAEANGWMISVRLWNIQPKPKQAWWIEVWNLEKEMEANFSGNFMRTSNNNRNNNNNKE